MRNILLESLTKAYLIKSLKKFEPRYCIVIEKDMYIINFCYNLLKYFVPEICRKFALTSLFQYYRLKGFKIRGKTFKIKTNFKN